MVAVQGPSILPQQCSLHLRQAVEASSYSLSKLGTCTILYLDDMLIMARSRGEASTHLATPMEFADRSGLHSEYKDEHPHSNTGIGVPCMYGFDLNSQDMTVALPEPKLWPLKKMATEMLGRQKTMAQELACLLRMMVASHPAILPAPLYYRLLDRLK